MRKLLVSSALALVVLGATTRSVEPASAFACGYCGWCLGGHTNALDENRPGESHGIHSYCEFIAGCPHPPCVGGFAINPKAGDFERVLTKAEAGDPRAALTLARKYSGSVVYNAERQALQFKTPCSGNDFVGHLPLTPEQNRRLQKG